MAKRCAVCGRKVATGNNVSHSHRKTKRTFKPNLQPVKVVDKDGKIKRIMVCTRCLKAGKVQRA